MAPRSREISDAVREASRARVLDAARELFAERGYFACRVADIGRHAGMSAGNVYWHFESKEAILRAILVDGFGSLETMTAEVAAEYGPARRKLEILVDRTLALYDHNKEFAVILGGLMGEGGRQLVRSLGFDMEEIGGRYHANLRRVFGEARSEGVVTLADPDRIDIRGALACGADVIIDVGCVFEGTVRLADGVAIGANCVLKNVTVEAGSQILPFSHLEGATIGANCRVGPYARLRPGAALADDVHIGNFVEVKASTIGRGSKANHLAYVGDTTMGAGVNFGAGAITANYDGANKHRTVIEDDASIGSNCVLVAPVTIGRGATIGGGSTIAKKAPAETLTVSRAKQISLPGWKRPVKQPKSQKG